MTTPEHHAEAILRADNRLEFRPREDGSFDEILARFADGSVHVETMSKHGCYVGLYWDDGRYCQFWVSSKKKLSYHHEDGASTPAPLPLPPSDGER